MLLSDTVVLDDADYLDGQFFFLLGPERIRDYPHIDVLALTPLRLGRTRRAGAAGRSSSTAPRSIRMRSSRSRGTSWPTQ